jgi:hypothetical protein
LTLSTPTNKLTKQDPWLRNKTKPLSLLFGLHFIGFNPLSIFVLYRVNLGPGRNFLSIIQINHFYLNNIEIVVFNDLLSHVFIDTKTVDVVRQY